VQSKYTCYYKIQKYCIAGLYQGYKHVRNLIVMILNLTNLSVHDILGLDGLVDSQNFRQISRFTKFILMYYHLDNLKSV